MAQPALAQSVVPEAAVLGGERSPMVLTRHEFDLQRAAGRCSVTGRDFEQGEEFHSALFEEGEGFRRVDYCGEAWGGPPEGCFCHFKSRVAGRKEPKKQLLIGNEGLLAFFHRLADETEPVRIQFRFVIALILMRKRLLRYEGVRREGDVEWWDVTLVHDQSRHSLIDPKLGDDQIERVSRELTAILHGDMREVVDQLDGRPPDAAACGDSAVGPREPGSGGGGAEA